MKKLILIPVVIFVGFCLGAAKYAKADQFDGNPLTDPALEFGVLVKHQGAAPFYLWGYTMQHLGQQIRTLAISYGVQSREILPVCGHLLGGDQCYQVFDRSIPVYGSAAQWNIERKDK